MSIKSEAIIIRDEITVGANTASRVGGNLVAIADDLIAKQNEINANTSKVGITTQQASDITTNNAKVGITTQQANDITTNNAKVGITTQQAADINTNTLKYSYPTADASKLAGIEVGSEVNTINSKTTGEPTGSTVVLNLVKISSANHASAVTAGTTIATTLYAIPV